MGFSWILLGSARNVWGRVKYWLKGPDFDVLGKELSGFAVFKMGTVDGDAWGVSTMVTGEGIVLGPVFVLEATTVDAGDEAATSWGLGDDVASKMDGGGSYWLPASCVGAGGV